MTLEQRVEQLKKVQTQLPGKLSEAAKNATLRAVEMAASLTPPTGDSVKGTNTRTGEMKQHWASDSQLRPQKAGSRYITVLANNLEYASYVNDGHRMDRHFVPGLYVNPYSGLLEYNPDGKGGIVVGTKTAYVPGLFMADKAKEEYRRALGVELKELEGMLK